MRLEWFTCRVQFVNDTDPLAYSNTSFPEPTRPPFHCFNANIPLVNQLPAVHRLLGAPHQVNCNLLNSFHCSRRLLLLSSRGREGFVTNYKMSYAYIGPMGPMPSAKQKS